MNATRPLDPFNESQWLHHIATVEQVGAFRMGHLLLMTAIFVAGMIGNVLTCLVIYCDRSMHNVTNYYLFNLAVSDLVVLIIMFIELIYKVRQLSDQQDEWGDLDCKVQFFMVGALWNNGVLIMTALAVERYVAVRHPLAAKRRRVRRRVARVMAAVWTAAVLETLPDVFVIRLVETRVGPVCFVALTWYTRVINAATAVVTFLLPLTVMLYMYIAIAITVNAGQNQNHGDNIFNHRNHRKKVNNLIIQAGVGNARCVTVCCVCSGADAVVPGVLAAALRPARAGRVRNPARAAHPPSVPGAVVRSGGGERVVQLGAQPATLQPYVHQV
ncbi:neuromedin-U receptor 2 isoform X2 [Amyelois transitella]|uniref:neuromedin-U receptor 2 isoform X2 n=1 Tax=Amyelois transitella TaxID=680683 RepID=UPI0029906059|nr:neuromedin-U receptor 2 isoform X2 [Amyelois transitella]